MDLYHVTSRKNLNSILKNGINPGSYFGTADIAEYYESVILDEEETPVIIKIPFNRIEKLDLHPDIPGIQEPITTVIGMSEDEIREEWENSGQTAIDCLNIIGSLQCKQVVAVTYKDVMNLDNKSQLEYWEQDQFSIG